MILRRLAQSLKEQNWTAITIEFVLLVLGVFLGIQAANWNTAALMTKRNRPSVTTVTGSVSTTSSGRTTALSRPRISAAISAAPKPRTSRPG